MTKRLDHDELRERLARIDPPPSLREAARILGVSRTTIARLRRPDRVPVGRAPGGPAVWGDLVVGFIPVGPAHAPVGRQTLASLAGLSATQVQDGIAWLRDHYPGLPLLSGASGYLFSTEPQAVARYRDRQLGAVLTTISRLQTGTIAPLLVNAPPWLREAQARNTQRLIEDLEMLRRSPLDPTRPT